MNIKNKSIKFVYVGADHLYLKSSLWMRSQLGKELVHLKTMASNVSEFKTGLIDWSTASA
jgi:hypothetical protein